MDRAALDALYNNRAAVPTHPQDLRRWAEDSAAARASLPVRRDLAYGEHARERIDFYAAPASGRPLVVFIHGGYWQAMSKDDAGFVAPGFASAAAGGIANVALLNYPLAPDAGMAQIVAAIRRALLWLWQQAADLGFDRDRIYVSGHSAGGHLTVMAALTDWATLDADAPADLVKGGLSISGLYDLRPIRQTYLNDKLGMDDAVAEANSPLLLLQNGRPAALPPLVCGVGGAETPAFHQQQHDFVTAYAAHGGAVTAITAPGRHHFDIVYDVAQPGGLLQAALAAMLR